MTAAREPIIVPLEIYVILKHQKTPRQKPKLHLLLKKQIQREIIPFWPETGHELDSVTKMTFWLEGYLMYLVYSLWY